MSDIVRWLDGHEGFGTWAGAAATFVAVVVALTVAVCGARLETTRRQEDRLRELKAAVAAVDYALVTLRDGLFNALDRRTRERKETMPTQPLLHMLDTCHSSIQYCLSLPFSNEDLLRIALNTIVTINMMSETLRRYQGDMKLGVAPVAELTELFGLMRPAVEADYSTVRKRATDLGMA